MNNIIIKPIIRTAYKECDNCIDGCNNCRYKRYFGIEYITPPTRLTREISCKICGKTRESDIYLCSGCGF